MKVRPGFHALHPPGGHPRLACLLGEGGGGGAAAAGGLQVLSLVSGAFIRFQVLSGQNGTETT
jgi:hypothetical protein